MLIRLTTSKNSKIQPWLRCNMNGQTHGKAMARPNMGIGPMYQVHLSKLELQSRLKIVIIRLSKTMLIRMAKTLMSLPLLPCIRPLQVMAFITVSTVHACVIIYGTMNAKRTQWAKIFMLNTMWLNLHKKRLAVNGEFTILTARTTSMNSKPQLWLICSMHAQTHRKVMARSNMEIGHTYQVPLNKLEHQSQLKTAIIRLSKITLIRMAKTMTSLSLLPCTQVSLAITFMTVSTVCA